MHIHKLPCHHFIGGDIMNEVKKLNKKLVAKNIRRMISESGYTIESIAADLEISDRLIYYWLNGKRTPALENVYGLAQLFNVSMESILV